MTAARAYAVLACLRARAWLARPDEAVLDLAGLDAGPAHDALVRITAQGNHRGS